MGRRLKLNCLSIARVLSAPSFASKSSSASIKYGDMTEFPSSMSQEDSSCDDHENGSCNKIMVVVNSSFEAKCALDWALSHAVQSQDTVVLLHALKPSSQGTEGREKRKLKNHQLVDDMKNMCQMKRPGVKVKVVKAAEGEEQGRTIVEEAKKQRVTLLVIGQRKRSLWWGFVRRLWGSNKRGSAANCNAVADYCIQNASCMTIAVRKKNKKLGGYLITTKRHKKFWLLA
ncbi:hypothetical protein QN277_014538 [Acacia crassicarpa]|uniref:UspA domain-containing protein n=1 Tax=Acacia crassicarpa TaxID=499986 RepID=A0AAE1IP03_9FABA|nr:hypothetical protein QN277_014538 [Acacia crassicarpa]